jgi:Flp pilus assembly protein TadD
MSSSDCRKLLCLILLLSAGCAGRLKSEAPDTYQARKRLAQELVARQDWQGAFAYADELHRERPGDAEVLALRGIIYRERALPAEAEADLREALRRDDRLAAAHSALGVLYDTTKRSEEAERHHRRAETLAPENAGYLNNLGFSLFLRGRTREAVEVYQRAARLDPTNRRIRTNLGFAYAASNDLPRAAREFELGGTPAEAKNNLGFAYERRGDLERALELYAEAVRLQPGWERARTNLAHVAGRLGRPASAAEAAPQNEVEMERSATP